jgi:hypothetical protein
LSRRKILFITVIIGVVALVIGLLASNWQQLHPQKITKAKIVGFTVDWGSLPPIVGTTMAISFNITIKNMGTENISNLNVDVKLLSNQTEDNIHDYLYFYDQNFTVGSGETNSTQVDFFVDLSIQQQMINSHQNFLATLSSNGTLLDEHKLF